MMFSGCIERKHWPERVKPFQPSVAFHEETSHLICSLNQMTGFYMECNASVNKMGKENRRWPDIESVDCMSQGCEEISNLLEFSLLLLV